MDIIFNSFSEFWNYLSGFVPEKLIQCLITISLISILYFLIFRMIFILCKSSKAIKILDIVFLAICLCVVFYYLPISLDIVKHNIGGVVV